ncbi:MAG: hypothetical protein H6Q13_2754 [Bacteroidetes bacterium]|nr:hypothetical protein [Bacteroidota bacterium]
MQTITFMIYKEVLEKRLIRKKEQPVNLEGMVNSGTEVAGVDKRKYIELKAAVNELENCVDIAESMMKLEGD